MSHQWRPVHPMHPAAQKAIAFINGCIENAQFGFDTPESIVRFVRCLPPYWLLVDRVRILLRDDYEPIDANWRYRSIMPADVVGVEAAVER